MILLIIQARCGSARLKNKIFLELNNKSILQTIIDKSKISNKINNIVVATSINIEDNKIYNFCNNNNIDCYRGDERDLIDRYYYLCKLLKPSVIIRITADCPFLDVDELDKMIYYFENNNYDYLYNTDELNTNIICPEGSDIEIFNFKALEYIWNEETEIREHSVGILRIKREFYNKFLNISYYDFKLNITDYKHNFIGIHLSIDDNNDYCVAKFIFDNPDTNALKQAIQVNNAIQPSVPNSRQIRSFLTKLLNASVKSLIVFSACLAIVKANVPVVASSLVNATMTADGIGSEGWLRVKERP